MSILRIAVFGTGNRAGKYIHYIAQHPDEAVLCCIVEPDNTRRKNIQLKYQLADADCYATDDKLFLANRNDIDAVIIASPDKMHYRQAMRCIENKWHILLEKPIATTREECIALAEAAENSDVIIGVCYVLRYHPMFQKVKEIIDSKELGRIISINFTNSIGIDRTLHTYVRGPWSREEDTCPVLLSKCSHDIDYLLWITHGRVKQQHSIGNRMWFREENAPIDATERCIDCPHELTCPYSATDMYLRRHSWINNFPVPQGKTLDEVLLDEMRNSIYGRCAFRCNNDVSDHKIVIMEMEDGATVSLTMDFLTHHDGRRFFIQCSNGEIEVPFDKVIVRNFSTRKDRVFDFSNVKSLPFHGNADMKLMSNFIAACKNEDLLIAPLNDCLSSHLACF